MGSKQHASKRIPASNRVTGQRKTARKDSSPTTGPMPVANERPPSQPRPRPQPQLQSRPPYKPRVRDIPEEDEQAENDVSLHDIAETFAQESQKAQDAGSLALRSDTESDDFVLDEEVHGTIADHPVINLTFEVPFRNASRDLIVKSDITFASFLSRVAIKMETSLICLSQIGYILPWKTPRSGKPVAKLLEDEDCFHKLIEHIWAYIDEQKAKNRGKGKVKPFSVQIIDTSEVEATGKGTAKKSNSAKPASSHQHIPGPPSVQDQEHQLLDVLERKHMCQEHSVPCYIQANGTHYQYTLEDLTIWAALLARRLATIDTPPDKLNLADKCLRQAQVKKRQTSQPPTSNPAETMAASSSEPPVWAQMMMMMMGGAFASNNPYAIRSSTRPDLLSSPTSPPHWSSPMPMKRTSSDITVDYPDLEEWLNAIQEHPVRNKHKEDFLQYAGTLVHVHKLFTIEDIIPLTGSELAQVSGMEFGMASRILRFAKEDASAMEKQKKART